VTGHLTPADLDPGRWWYFNEGTDRYAHRSLGAHPGPEGTTFAVWAPNAAAVAVVGDFDGWGQGGHHLEARGQTGVWAGFVAEARVGHRYKFRIRTRDFATLDKADPFAVRTEEPPGTASVIAELSYSWGDGGWMARRHRHNHRLAPISIYEVHLGSWGRTVAGEGRFPGYRQLGEALADHASAHDFTHVELLPVMEHPFYGSWGYQTTAYFAPTARYGQPQDFMALVDTLHQAGVGVILDWVPSHFPDDPHGLGWFDGTHLFEHADPRQGRHPDWDSLIFNLGRLEVRSFLLSSACHWLERYHVDGIRVDAVASMLYRDYSRAEGEWVPNQYGGREDLEAVSFLQELNTVVYEEFPDVQTFAEESTAWPGVSRPVHDGGLGFGFKWDMGWMHDTLQFMRRDPAHRGWHLGELTFRAVYAFSENFCLPLSHDEVVHGKGSLLEQMPGDRWQQLANLRLLYGYQWSQPGKKLLFMGGELAAVGDWGHERTLDWALHDAPGHAGVRQWVAQLNGLYASLPALHRLDTDPAGFEWVEANDTGRAVIAYLRHPGDGGPPVLVVLNAACTVWHDHRIGVPRPGRWAVVANSDDEEWGGSGAGPPPVLATRPVPSHGRYHSLTLTLPPLGVLFLVPDDGLVDQPPAGGR
jgi:1,4-alpha-glucan branching enzyme